MYLKDPLMNCPTKTFGRTTRAPSLGQPQGCVQRGSLLAQQFAKNLSSCRFCMPSVFRIFVSSAWDHGLGGGTPSDDLLEKNTRRKTEAAHAPSLGQPQG